MKNTSGIHPRGDRVLIKPDEVERVTEGGIIIPDPVGEQYGYAQAYGTFVEAGPDAWIDHVEVLKDPSGAVISIKTVGYSQPFAKPGERIQFAKYGGIQVEGMDGEVYRVMNDEDVTSAVEDGVKMTDLKARTPVFQSRKKA